MWCCCSCVSERSDVKRCNVVLLVWCVSERSGVMRRNVVLLLVCFREKWCNAVY